MNSIQTDVEHMIEKHGDRAAIEAWHKATECKGQEQFDHWYSVASTLRDLAKGGKDGASQENQEVVR